MLLYTFQQYHWPSEAPFQRWPCFLPPRPCASITTKPPPRQSELPFVCGELAMHCLFQASPVTRRVWCHYYRGGNRTQKGAAPGPPATKRGAWIGTRSPDLRAHCPSASTVTCRFIVKLHFSRVGSYYNRRASYFLALLQSQISKQMENQSLNENHLR